MNHELVAARKKALTVDCPYPSCLAKPGDPCRRIDGHELVALPAHMARLRVAGVKLTPTTPEELAEPTPPWSPTGALGGDR